MRSSRYQSPTLNAKMTLLTEIYKPARLYIGNRLGRIIHKNNMIHGSTSDIGSLYYQGKSYSNMIEGDEWQESFALDESLVEEFEKVRRDTEEYRKELKYVDRSLSILLSQNLNDITLRKILGENIYSLISQYERYFSKNAEISKLEENQFVEKYKFLTETLQNRVIDNVLSQAMYDS